MGRTKPLSTLQTRIHGLESIRQVPIVLRARLSILVEMFVSNIVLVTSSVASPVQNVRKTPARKKKGKLSYSCSKYYLLVVDLVEVTNIPTRFVQSFGVASASEGFEGMYWHSILTNSQLYFLGVDGVLGIGKPIQTIITLSPNESLIPTITENLLNNDLIQKNRTGIFIPPPGTNTVGRIDWGGISDEQLTSPVNFVPNTEVPGLQSSWNVDVSSIK